MKIWIAISACGLSVACSGMSSSAHGTGGSDSEGGVCNVTAITRVIDSASHVPECSPLSYPDNPPTGGNHYPVWAAFRRYDFAVPRGYWVHDLEHGAIVYSYNCPDGCPDELARAQVMIDALQDDPTCDGEDVPRRVVLTPDPLLDVRWAASGWGFALRADCLDESRFSAFYMHHFGGGPENFCAAGVAFSASPCP